MKMYFKRTFIWLGLSILMMILWIAGIFIGNAIFPSSLMEMSADSKVSGELMLFLACLMNTGVILYFIYNCRIKGWILAGILFLVTFGIQSFMAQIETLWFNDSLKLPINGIWAIVTGGAVMNLVFAFAAVWLTGNFSTSLKSEYTKVKPDIVPLLKRVILFSVIIWPAVYFMAGYFIAWQFSEVRLFYSGSTEMASFYDLMKDNLVSGLYFFQIFRGVLWILIALLVFSVTYGSLVHKGIILGLLLACLGSSGLILPNPVMPYMVRMGHLVETASSSFLWGIILAWGFAKFTSDKTIEPDVSIDQLSYENAN
jgi:hypothetical protein